MTDTPSSPGEERPPSPKIDTAVPQTARVWNYWLGGKDNYAVDRALGDQIAHAFPHLTVEIARAVRAFLARAVRYLVEEAGIHQFIDVGTGLPTANNTHEVAQALDPQSRIVYVDNDPLVLVHARALLTSCPEGATDYIDADARDTDTILREADRTLDRTRPVGIVMSGVLAHLPSYGEARSVVRRLMAGVASGSHLVISDGVAINKQVAEAARIWNESANPPYEFRTAEQIAGYFDGLELVEPGVVTVTRWRPEPGQAGPPPELANYVGVARKPA